MKIFKPQKLSILTRCFEANREYFFSVAVIGFFPFDSQELLTEVELWKVAPEQLGVTPLDEVMPKRRAEFLVKGSAYVAGGQPQATCPVRVQIGSLDKALYVIGDRHWKGQHQSEPRPFTEIPIEWDRAFGGEGFERNPVGKGVAPVETEHGPVQFLPNIELPGRMITRPKDRPEPAGYMPYDMIWPQRFSKVGTYDERWLKELFPGYARDFDWSFFNVAPLDQQMDGVFRGDEAFVVEGMHPSHPRLTGRLPGVHGRCFITQATEQGDRFIEIETKLDTVWLFPHLQRGVVCFHGMVPIREDDGADVTEIIIGAEWLHESKPAESYREVIAKRLDPEYGAVNALIDRDLLPTGAEWVGGVTEEEKALYAPVGLIRENMERRGRREIEAARAELAAQGLDPDQFIPQPPPEDDIEITLDNIPALDEKLRQQEEQAQKIADEAGFVSDGEAVNLQVGPPQFSAAEQLEGHRAAAAQARAMGFVLSDLEAQINDPEHANLLQQQEDALREYYRRSAHIQQSVQPMGPEDAARFREAVAEAHRRGESFERWDLTGADLSGLDLTGACFREAFLERVNFTDAILNRVDFSRAVLARAILIGAQIEGANFQEANLGATNLRTVRFDQANLKEAIFYRSDLQHASFVGSDLAEADFSEATFGYTDFSDAHAPELTFYQNDLRGCKFTRADINDTDFMESQLEGVNFEEANLTDVTFLSSTGRGVRFNKARMKSTCFVLGCSFQECDFQEAFLGEANMRGTDLARSNFTKAQLDGADLSETNLEGTTFYRATGKEARFTKAILRDAAMISANLMEADLQKADIRGANFLGANLFGAHFGKVHSDEATKVQESNQKRVTIYPLRRKS